MSEEQAPVATQEQAAPEPDWGIAGLFEPTAIAIRSRLKMVWYGQAGSGKTLLGIRFPKCLVMDCEQGWDVYKEVYPQIPFLQTTSFTKAEEAIDKLLRAGNRLSAQTLMIDPVTVLYSDLKATHLTEEAMHGKAFGTAGYSAVERDWNRFLAKVSKLARRMNVIMTARERGIFDSKETTFDAGRGLDYTADIVLQLFERETGERMARTIKERMIPPRLERRNAYDAWAELSKHYGDSIFGKITSQQMSMISGMIAQKEADKPGARDTVNAWLHEQFGITTPSALSSYQAMQVINKLS